MRESNSYSGWARAGVALSVNPSQEPIDLETLIVTSATEMRDDPRLFWAVASWLAIHYELVNTRRLGSMLDELDGTESATLGALLEIATAQSEDRYVLGQLATHCRPLERAEVLFHLYAGNEFLTRMVREEALGVFLRWGFLHNQVSEKKDAIRPIEWIIQECPELRARLILGASLDAEVLQALEHGPATVTALHMQLGYTYAAVHTAASRLFRRGLLERTQKGRAVEISLRRGMHDWIQSFPV